MSSGLLLGAEAAYPATSVAIFSSCESRHNFGREGFLLFIAPISKMPETTSDLRDVGSTALTLGRVFVTWGEDSSAGGVLVDAVWELLRKNSAGLKSLVRLIAGGAGVLVLSGLSSSGTYAPPLVQTKCKGSAEIVM